MSFPTDVQAALDQAATSKANADAAAGAQVTADAVAQAADVASVTAAKQLTTDAATAIAALTNFLVVSPPTSTPNAPAVPVTPAS